MKKRRLAIQTALATTLLIGVFGCSDNPVNSNAPPSFEMSIMAPAPELITVEFEGTVTTVSDPDGHLEARVTVDDAVFGVFVYDEMAVDQHPQPEIGRYRFAEPQHMIAVKAGRLLFASHPSAVDITIKLTDNKQTSFLKDQFEVKSTSNSTVLPGVGVSVIDLMLIDETATTLASDALSGQCPDALEWPYTRTLTITGVDGWIVEARIDLIPPSEASRRKGGKDNIHQD